MRIVFSLSILALLASCAQSTAERSESNRAQAELKCVERAGFLVPADKVFKCKLPNGSLVDVFSL